MEPKWIYNNSFKYGGYNYIVWVKANDIRMDGSHIFISKVELATLEEIEKARSESDIYYIKAD